MAMQTDVKAASLPVSGIAYNGRTRLRGIIVEPGGATGFVQFRDGSSSDVVVLRINTTAGAAAYSILVPAEGMLFETALYVEMNNAKATVFYG